MTSPQTTIHPHLHHHFQKSFRWTLLGSIIYEVFKTAHLFLLLQLMPTALYGSMGSLFALIYLVTYIADLGATNSIPPFYNIFSASKQSFKTFLLKYSLLPHAPIIITCALIATYFATAKITYLPYLIIIPLLIILETSRSFLRLLLHTTFQAKRIVAVDLTIFFFYLCSIWIPIYFFNIPLSLNLIFIAHLADSIVAIATFAIMTYQFYKKLPDHQTSLPPSFAKRLLSTRTFNYLLRVTRNMFTSNFLTPLFAVKFGLSSAGLFYFASTFANSAQSIIKSVIGYSGNALLANLKDSPQSAKKEAFRILFQKLARLILPVIIIVGINHQTLTKFSRTQSTTQYIIALSLLFLVIAFTEFFFMIYEQFYIIEEAANKLFFFKIFELTCLYSLVTSNLVTSPFTTLVGILVIRCISFAIIALNAWFTWKILPNLKTSAWYLAGSVTIALILAAAAKIWL